MFELKVLSREDTEKLLDIGMLDGSYITGIRTGAAGALGAKLLARKESENLLLVGAGNIATFQIAATLKLIPGIKNVMIYDPMSYEFAKKKAEDIKNILESKFKLMLSDDVKFEAAENIEKATGESDIIITVTPSKKPIIKKEWVKKGTHFSCIGADMEGKEEIDPEIFRNAKIYVDNVNQCINVGETEVPIKTGILKTEEIVGEIGDLIIGIVAGRENDEDITIFDATGMALLDMATAKLAFRKADEIKLGQKVDL